MMRVMLCSGAAIGLFLSVAVSMPSWAQETPPAAEGASPAPPAEGPMLELDAQMRLAKEAYEEAIKDLTEEQKAELAALESEFAKTMEADMQIFHRAAQMEYCLTNDNFFKADTNNVKAFVEWRKNMKAEQEKQWSAHKTKRRQIKYLKPYILDGYYRYQEKLLRMMGAAVAKVSYDNGAFNDTDCDALSKKLKLGQ